MTETEIHIVHAADIHLDSPLRGLGRLSDDDLADRLRLATRAAFDNLIDHCLATQPAALVLAGDLYDGDWRDYSTGVYFTNRMRDLADAGIPCTHIDSHRHVHALPVIRRAVAAVACGRGLPLRRPVESHFRAGGGLTSQIHRGLIGVAWRVTSIGAPRTRAADHFIGVSMQGADRFAQQLASAIDGLSPGTTEIMVHPGRVDDALVAADGYTWQRERELAALVSPLLRERLRRDDVTLIGFRAL